MKKREIHQLLFYLMFMLAPVLCSAQKIHFSDTSNKWMTYNYVSQGASNGHAYYKKYFYVDSIVNENGHTYSVLNKDNENLMLVREEGNKIYVKPTGNNFGGLMVRDTTEFLYFDYDLQVGDTLKMPLTTTAISDTYSIHRVESIDSIIINGIWHKNLHMKVISGFTGQYLVTEGLGTGSGAIIAGYTLNYAGHLICFQNNGTHPLADLSDCAKLNVEDEVDAIAGDFKISPNPATDNVFISYTGNTGTDFDLHIMDISGRSILHSQFKKDIRIDVSTLQPGIYIIRFLHEGSSMKTYKLSISK